MIMADYTQLKTEIDNKIKTNGVGSITGQALKEILLEIVAGLESESSSSPSSGITPINVAIYCYDMGGEWEISLYDAPSNLGELVQAYIDNAQSAANTAVADLNAYQWNLYLVGGADSVSVVVTPQYIEVDQSFVQLRFSDHQFDGSNRQFAIRITTSGTVTGYTYSAADA